MTRKLLLLVILLPLFSIAQKKTHWSLGGEYYFGSTYGNGFGPHIAVNKAVTPKFDVGLGISAVFFDGLQTVYPPLSAQITYFPLSYSNAVSPFIIINPGYSFYKSTAVYYDKFAPRTRRDSLITTGGRTLYTGVGVHFPNVSGINTFISIGYSSYGSMLERFTIREETTRVTQTKTNFGGLTIRAGIMW